MEDDGLFAVFSDFTLLHGLKKLDLSENNITDKGLDSIRDYIGANVKTQLKSINFSNNLLKTKAVIKFFYALEAKNNQI